MSGVQFVVGTRDFSLLRNLSTSSGTLLSVGIRGYFQESKVVVVQGWGSECMEQYQYSPYMPSCHGQGQLDFHNFYLSTPLLCDFTCVRHLQCRKVMEMNFDWEPS
jgi:hypothetical protein